MCLAIPVKVIKIDNNKGIGEIGGVSREIDLTFIENIELGEYVLLHAGFAIQKINEEEAQKTFSIWEEIEKTE